MASGTSLTPGCAEGEPGTKKGVAAMDWPKRTGGVLCADGVPLPEVAQRFGTPCYVYSAAAIQEAVRSFQNAMSGLPLRLCYAVKANPNGAILRLLAREGLGAEVVSGGELVRALRAGFSAEDVLFTGGGRTPRGASCRTGRPHPSDRGGIRGGTGCPRRGGPKDGGSGPDRPSLSRL